MRITPLVLRGKAFVLLAATAILFGCSSFDLISIWRSPDFKGPAVNKVMVLGIGRSEATRRIFEDGFTQALSAASVTAHAAYTQLPDSGQISEDKLRAAVKKSGADSVLITRLLEVEQHSDIVRPSGGYYRGGAYGFYGSSWNMGPASVSTYNVFKIETTLWDMRNETLIWSGVTQAIQPSNIAKATTDMAKVLIEQMRKDGVI